MILYTSKEKCEEFVKPENLNKLHYSRLSRSVWFVPTRFSKTITHVINNKDNFLPSNILIVESPRADSGNYRTCFRFCDFPALYHDQVYHHRFSHSTLKKEFTAVKNPSYKIITKEYNKFTTKNKELPIVVGEIYNEKYIISGINKYTLSYDGINPIDSILILELYDIEKKTIILRNR